MQCHDRTTSREVSRTKGWAVRTMRLGCRRRWREEGTASDLDGDRGDSDCDCENFPGGATGDSRALSGGAAAAEHNTAAQYSTT